MDENELKNLREIAQQLVGSPQEAFTHLKDFEDLKIGRILAFVDDEHAKKIINCFSMGRSGMITVKRKEAKGEFKSISPASFDNLLNTTAMAGGLAGVGVGTVTLSHVKDLLTGQSVTYPLVIKPNNIIFVVRSRLDSNKFSAQPDNRDGNIIVIARKGENSAICRVAIQSVNAGTQINFSGLNIGKDLNHQDLKDGMGRAVRNAFDSRDFLGSLIESASQAAEDIAETAFDVVTDSFDINSIVSAVDTYANELIKAEKQAEEAAKEAIRAQAAEDEKAAEKIRQDALKALLCIQCGGAHGNNPVCPNCSAPSGYIEPKK